MDRKRGREGERGGGGERERERGAERERERETERQRALQASLSFPVLVTRRLLTEKKHSQTLGVNYHDSTISGRPAAR